MAYINRNIILEAVRTTLDRSGFDITEEFIGRTICFDVIAKRDNTLLVIKVLFNIDSFNKSSANEIKVISSSLDGSALVVGNHSSRGVVEDGAVYLRHGVPIMSPHTISEYFFENRPPLVFSAPGGFFVRIDGKKLKKIREKRNISLGTLAKAAGVSRRAVAMYEEGMSAMVEIAIKLEDFINEPIILPSDPLDERFKFDDIDTIKSGLQSKITGTSDALEHLSDLGYDVFPTQHSPFDALTEKKKVLILTGIERGTKLLKRRAKIVFSISQLVDRHSVFFVQKIESLPNIEGIPVISLDELLTINEPDELLELIDKRS